MDRYDDAFYDKLMQAKEAAEDRAVYGAKMKRDEALLADFVPKPRTRTMIESEAAVLARRPYVHLHDPNAGCPMGNLDRRPINQQACVARRLEELRLEWRNAS